MGLELAELSFLTVSLLLNLVLQLCHLSFKVSLSLLELLLPQCFVAEKPILLKIASILQIIFGVSIATF